MKEQILAVQRMQDYMEAHLDEKLGLSELSEVSLFSPWYSYRIFREYTGLTPSGYIRRLRLAKAALRIKNKHIHMIDAAFDLGFGSGGGYSCGVPCRFPEGLKGYIRRKPGYFRAAAGHIP